MPFTYERVQHQRRPVAETPTLDAVDIKEDPRGAVWFRMGVGAERAEVAST